MRKCLLVFSGNHVYIRAMLLLAILYYVYGCRLMFTEDQYTKV